MDGKKISYIKINEYTLPMPKRGIECIVTTAVDAGRNANGVIVGQKIGNSQYKLNNLEWPWLTAETWKAILSHLEQFFVNVEFIDPVRNKPTIRRMYCSDRTAEPYYLDENGKPTHYRNCRVNLIDTGATLL